MVERGVEEPLYRQLAAELGGQIRSGVYRVGDRIPSEAELQEQHGISRETVRLAMNLLRVEGLVTIRQGSGTFAADPKTARMPYRASVVHSAAVRAQRPGLDAFRAELKALGREGFQDLRVERVPAPEEIASRLGLEPGEPVVVRRHRQEVEGQPYALVDSWFAAELADGTPLAENVKVPGGTDALMARMGWEALTRTDEVTARMPTPEEAQELVIAGGVPVVIVVATELAAGGKPVEVYTRVHPANRFVLVYEVSKADR